MQIQHGLLQQLPLPAPAAGQPVKVQVSHPLLFSNRRETAHIEAGHILQFLFRPGCVLKTGLDGQIRRAFSEAQGMNRSDSRALQHRLHRCFFFRFLDRLPDISQLECTFTAMHDKALGVGCGISVPDELELDQTVGHPLAVEREPVLQCARKDRHPHRFGGMVQDIAYGLSAKVECTQNGFGWSFHLDASIHV